MPPGRKPTFWKMSSGSEFMVFKKCICRLQRCRMRLSSWPAFIACPQQKCNSWAPLPSFSPLLRNTLAPGFSKRQQTKVYLFWFGWWQHWSPSQQHMDTGHGWENTNATLRGLCASPWHTESMGNLEQESGHAHNTTWHECRGHGDRRTQRTYRVPHPPPSFFRKMSTVWWNVRAITWFNLEFIQFFSSICSSCCLLCRGISLWYVGVFSGWPSGFCQRVLPPVG